MSDFDIKTFLKQLPERPGVYKMLDAQAQVIYVGKAKNLKRRVSSYFQKKTDHIKTQRLVSQVQRIEVVLTETEAEALLLERTLIKRFNPRYNVLFRDDKSYPYIHVTLQHAFPGIYFYRGKKQKRGAFFGPFVNAGAVYQTLHSLQKIFKLRPCSDTVFKNRSRPCLQYQIGRCSAPCVGKITQEAYQRDVEEAVLFLSGKDHAVLERLAERMQAAAEQLRFEEAAQLRDQISALKAIQQQHLILKGRDQDVLGFAERHGQVAVVLMRYQGETLWGTEQFFPKGAWLQKEEILAQFVSQYYGASFPKKILLPFPLEEQQQWFDALGVPLKVGQSRLEKELLHLANMNAQAALNQHLAQKSTQLEKLAHLQEVLHLPELPLHMECFDISHTQGNETVASCVHFSEGVPDKQRYRRFNIRNAAKGDDYAAIYEAVYRHYKRLIEEGLALPALLVIDGGKGQLQRACAALADVGVQLPVISVAKGEGRKAGLEVLYRPDQAEPIDLPSDHPALHIVNFIRDEAHRFALLGHRARRQKKPLKMTLEAIEGVGPKTRRKLLLHFGGMKSIERASVSELEKVPGVSKKLAKRIYQFFHGEIE